MTRIVNKRKGPYDVYIGRGSPFGNPFKIGPDGTREEVIEKFRKYFYEQLAKSDLFEGQVASLKGKTLGCFCKPLPCHGDVIVEYLDGTPPPSDNVDKLDVVCIVGSVSLADNSAAKMIIDLILDQYDPASTLIISGGAIGIDTMVATRATQRAFSVMEFKPEVQQWDDLVECIGFKTRNRVMALQCDVLYRIADVHSKTYGSGWTADRAEEFGKKVYRFEIEGNVVMVEPDNWPGGCH